MPSDPVIVSLRQQLKRANDKLLPLKAKLKEQAKIIRAQKLKITRLEARLAQEMSKKWIPTAQEMSKNTLK